MCPHKKERKRERDKDQERGAGLIAECEANSFGDLRARRRRLRPLGERPLEILLYGSPLFLMTFGSRPRPHSVCNGLQKGAWWPGGLEIQSGGSCQAKRMRPYGSVERRGTFANFPPDHMAMKGRGDGALLYLPASPQAA